MPSCNAIHFKKDPKNPKKILKTPCYYIAGNCVSNPINQGGFGAFLRAVYPYHHGLTYAESLRAHEHPVSHKI